MPHIHTTPGQVDASVTGFMIRDDFDEPKMLFHMHRKLDSLLPAGGHVELDETPWVAMAHELREETGYELTQLRILQPKTRLKQVTGIALHPVPLVSNTHALPDNHFHADLDYLFVTSAEPIYAPSEGEATELIWLTQHELVELESSKIFDNTREIALFCFEAFTSPDFEQVPTSEFSLEKLNRLA